MSRHYTGEVTSVVPKLTENTLNFTNKSKKLKLRPRHRYFLHLSNWQKLGNVLLCGEQEGLFCWLKHEIGTSIVQNSFVIL